MLSEISDLHLLTAVSLAGHLKSRFIPLPATSNHPAIYAIIRGE